MTVVLRSENNILKLIRCSLVLAAAWLGRFSGQVHRNVSFYCFLILFLDQSTADLDWRRAAMQCYLAVPRHLSNHFYLSRDRVQCQIYITLVVGNKQQIQFLFYRFQLQICLNHSFFQLGSVQLPDSCLAKHVKFGQSLCDEIVCLFCHYAKSWFGCNFILFFLSTFNYKFLLDITSYVKRVLVDPWFNCCFD